MEIYYNEGWGLSSNWLNERYLPYDWLLLGNIHSVYLYRYAMWSAKRKTMSGRYFAVKENCFTMIVKSHNYLLYTMSALGRVISFIYIILGVIKQSRITLYERYCSVRDIVRCFITPYNLKKYIRITIKRPYEEYILKCKII